MGVEERLWVSTVVGCRQAKRKCRWKERPPLLPLIKKSLAAWVGPTLDHSARASTGHLGTFLRIPCWVHKHDWSLQKTPDSIHHSRGQITSTELNPPFSFVRQIPWPFSSLLCHAPRWQRVGGYVSAPTKRKKNMITTSRKRLCPSTSRYLIPSANPPFPRVNHR